MASAAPSTSKSTRRANSAKPLLDLKSTIFAFFENAPREWQRRVWSQNNPHRGLPCTHCASANLAQECKSLKESVFCNNKECRATQSCSRYSECILDFVTASVKSGRIIDTFKDIQQVESVWKAAHRESDWDIIDRAAFNLLYAEALDSIGLKQWVKGEKKREKLPESDEENAKVEGSKDASSISTMNPKASVIPSPRRNREQQSTASASSKPRAQQPNRTFSRPPTSTGVGSILAGGLRKRDGRDEAGRPAKKTRLASPESSSSSEEEEEEEDSSDMDISSESNFEDGGRAKKAKTPKPSASKAPRTKYKSAPPIKSKSKPRDSVPNSKSSSGSSTSSLEEVTATSKSGATPDSQSLPITFRFRRPYPTPVSGDDGHTQCLDAAENIAKATKGKFKEKRDMSSRLSDMTSLITSRDDTIKTLEPQLRKTQESLKRSLLEVANLKHEIATNQPKLQSMAQLEVTDIALKEALQQKDALQLKTDALCVEKSQLLAEKETMQSAQKLADANMKIQMEALQKRNTELTSHNKTLTGEKTALNAQKDALMTEWNDKEAQLQQIIAEKINMAKDIEQYTAKTRSFVAEQQQRCAELQCENSMIKEQAEKLKVANTELTSENFVMLAERDAFTGQFRDNAAQRLLDALRARNGVLLEERSLLREEKAGLEKEMSVLMGEAGDVRRASDVLLLKEKEALLEERGTWSEERERLTQRCTELEAEIQRSQSERARLGEAATTKEERVTALERLLSVSQTDHAALSDQVKTISQSRDTLMTEKDALNRLNTTLRDDIDRIVREMNSLNAEKETLRLRDGELAKQLELVTERATAFEHERDEVAQRLHSAATRLTEVTNERDASVQHRYGLDTKVTALELELESFRQSTEIASLLAQIRTIEASLEESQTATEVAHSEKEMLQTSYATLQAQYSELQAQSVNLGNQLKDRDDLRARIDMLEGLIAEKDVSLVEKDIVLIEKDASQQNLSGTQEKFSTDIQRRRDATSHDVEALHQTRRDLEAQVFELRAQLETQSINSSEVVSRPRIDEVAVGQVKLLERKLDAAQKSAFKRLKHCRRSNTREHVNINLIRRNLKTALLPEVIPSLNPTTDDYTTVLQSYSRLSNVMHEHLTALKKMSERHLIELGSVGTDWESLCQITGGSESLDIGGESSEEAEEED